jgi:hypothetical protein
MRDTEHEAREALRTVHSGSRRPSHALDARRERERKVLSPNDARLKRPRPPGVQLNVTIRPELKKSLVELGRDHGMTLIEMVESALTMFLAEKQAKRHA